METIPIYSLNHNKNKPESSVTIIFKSSEVQKRELDPISTNSCIASIICSYSVHNFFQKKKNILYVLFSVALSCIFQLHQANPSASQAKIESPKIKLPNFPQA